MALKSRKIGLTAHIVFSVGWLGAIIPYLTLAMVGLLSRDAQVVRSAYLSMEMIGWFAIVPLSVGALATGLIQSLSTPVGLFRQWWVVAKLLLTTMAILVLLRHMEAIGRMADIAATDSLSRPGARILQSQLALHAVGGLGVVLLATILSIFKPWGPTGFKFRMFPALSSLIRLLRVPEYAPKTMPRWVGLVGIHVVGFAVLGGILHLIGRHLPSS